MELVDEKKFNLYKNVLQTHFVQHAHPAVNKNEESLFPEIMQP